MTYEAPAIRWDALRADLGGADPVVEVAAELSALGAAERALLEARLTWRCEVPAVRVAPGGRAAIAFDGATTDRITAAFRAAADAAISTVAADAAAGWTAADERERHRPFSWDDPAPARPWPVAAPAPVLGGPAAVDGPGLVDGPVPAGGPAPVPGTTPPALGSTPPVPVAPEDRQAGAPDLDLHLGAA